MNKYIFLRDDDTSYFTNFNDLKNAYGELLGTIPITLATVPFVHGSEEKIKDFDLEKDKFRKLYEWEKNAAKDELDKYHTTHPIGNNKELLDKLKPLVEQKKIEIALHGICHRYDERGAEMYEDAVSLYEIRSAKEYLEKCFNTRVTTFIPPSNTIDLKTAERIHALNMNLLSSGTPKGHSYVEKVIACMRDASPLIEKIKKRAKNAPIKTRNGINVYSSNTFGQGYDIDKLYNNISDRLDTYGFAGLGTHYWFLNKNDNNRSDYRKLIDRLASIEGVEFVTASNYYNKIAKK